MWSESQMTPKVFSLYNGRVAVPSAEMGESASRVPFCETVRNWVLF